MDNSPPQSKKVIVSVAIFFFLVVVVLLTYFLPKLAPEKKTGDIVSVLETPVAGEAVEGLPSGIIVAKDAAIFSSHSFIVKDATGNVKISNVSYTTIATINNVFGQYVRFFTKNRYKILTSSQDQLLVAKKDNITISVDIVEQSPTTRVMINVREPYFYEN